MGKWLLCPQAVEFVSSTVAGDFPKSPGVSSCSPDLEQGLFFVPMGKPSGGGGNMFKVICQQLWRRCPRCADPGPRTPGTPATSPTSPTSSHQLSQLHASFPEVPPLLVL